MFRHVIREQLKVPAKIDYLGELRDFVTKVGRRYGFSERVINAFKLSIDEAATNIIKHAYRDWSGDITIRALIKKHSLTIVLIDQGKYFDPRQVSDPDLQRYVDIGKKGGLGIFIMRRLLDDIDYRKTEEGNELWLFKSRDVARRRKISVPSIPLSLKVRYWFFTMGIFTLIIVTGYLFFFIRQNEKIISVYTERSRRVSTNLCNDILINLDDLSPEKRQQLIESGSMGDIEVMGAVAKPINALKMSHEQGLYLRVYVVDKVGTILASTEAEQVLATNGVLPEKAIRLDEDLYRYHLPSGEEILDFIQPVKSPEGEILCRTHVQISYKDISADIARGRVEDLKFALLVWAVGIVSLFLMVYIVMNPFRRLQEWVKALGQPGVAEEMDIDSSTEVGEIAQAFSDITQQLQESQKNLAEQERLQKEMQVAKEIQQTLLPSEFPDIEGYEISSYYEAAKEVGGDYFDFVEVDKDTLGIVVGDVSGKGVPGSLVMTMIRTALRTEARGIKDAAEVLARVNDFVVNDMKKGMFVTLFYVIIDSKRRRLNYASAGHNPMILYRASSNKTYYLNPRGFPIGISLPDKDLFRKSIESDTIALAEDDILLVYTDGITEAMNLRRYLFGEERFLAVIRRFGDKKAKEFVQFLQEEIISFTEGNPQNDDITLVAIKEKTSAEKVELSRAQKAFEMVQDGKSIKEACETAGISTYGYNKYREQFEKGGIDSFTLSADVESIEVKHLSIEEKTKIFDVIRRFPEYGAKRINEELNTERYGHTEISASRIYEELVRSRLNTKQLREGFVSRSGKRKRRIKPPGTPLLTIDGDVIIQTPGMDRPFYEEEEIIEAEEEVTEKKPESESEWKKLTPEPLQESDETEVVDRAETESLTEMAARDLLSLDIEELLTTPLEDLFDKRRTDEEGGTSVKRPAAGEELITDDLPADYSDGAETLVEDEEAASIGEVMDEWGYSGGEDSEIESQEKEAVKDESAAAKAAEPVAETTAETGPGTETEPFAGDEGEPPHAVEEMGFDRAPSRDRGDTADDDEQAIAAISTVGDKYDSPSEVEELADLDVEPRDDSKETIDEDEIAFAQLIRSGAGLDEPPVTQEEVGLFEDEGVADAEIVEAQEEGSPVLEQPELNEPFEEFLQIEEEHGVSESHGELEEEVSEKLLEQAVESQFEEKEPPVSAEQLWDIREIKLKKQEPITEEQPADILSFDDLIDMLEAEYVESSRQDDEFDSLLREAVKSSGMKKRVITSNVSGEKDDFLRVKKLQSAMRLYKSGSYEKAIITLENLVEQYPNDSHAHVILGNACYRSRRYEQAIREYEKVISLDPHNVTAFENLGVIYANRGDLVRAVRQWERLLVLNPNRTDIRESIKRARKYIDNSLP